MFKLIVVCGALATAPVLHAQPAPPSAGRAPGATPPSTYESAFADYKPWSDPEPVSWRAINASVGALGGHMGHLRGSVERMPHAMPPTGSAPAAMTPARPGGAK